jgi:ribonucleoside-diphosphate reductase alpha chain
MVFSFPIQSPETSVNKDDLTALEQLEIWKTYQLYWCEHKPSCTVYVGDDEWMEVGAWVHRNFDLISGISFLPRSDHVYKQAPYTAITEEEYYAFLDKMPKTGIDINLLATFEAGDMTSGSQEYACAGGNCEL